MDNFTLQDCKIDDYAAWIPIRNRKKELIAKTIVDIEDWHRCMERRWSYSEGRVVGTVNGKTVKFHRWLIDAPSGMVVDHINRDPLDNRKTNLRIITQSQNCQNRDGNSRGYFFNRRYGMWEASVKLNYRSIYLGRFATEAEAAEVARQWRSENMPYSMN